MEKELYIQNRKARFEYAFLDEYVAGVVLLGTEVKSIRAGQVSLTDSYCHFIQGELWARSLSITPLDKNYVHETQRPRKLLLRKPELKKLEKKLDKGLSIIITAITIVNGKIKFKIALAQGKKLYDKRESIKAKDNSRQLTRELGKDF